VFALDQIGHGLTSGERGVFGSLDELAANATGLAAIAGSDVPVVLAGHSLGSLVTALAASRTPDAYAGYVMSGSILSPLDWVAELADGGDLDLDPAALSTEPAYLDALVTDPLAFTSAASARTLATALPPAWMEVGAALPAVTRPILLVHGEQDPIAPVDEARRWAERLPAGRLAVIPGSLHDVLNDRSHETVALIVAAFVAEVALHR
jgi:alpha-beta hydrolase superfamily lysophospholipase